MKNSKFLLCIILLVQGFLFVSCEKDETEKYTLKLDKEFITIDFSGGEESIEITASAEWTVTDVPEWIYISPDNGEEFTEFVYISVDTNDEVEARSATLAFTCGNLTKTVVVEQLGLEGSKPYLKINRTPVMSVGIRGGTENIKIITNQSWNITDIPDWLYVSRTSGEGTAELVMQVIENRQKNGRGAGLVFRTDDFVETLVVNQPGLLDVLRSPWLPVFRYKEIGFNSSLEWFDLKLYGMFINPGIKEKIYLGNLVSHNATPHTDIPAFTGYTFHPITISTGSPVGGMKTYIPSSEEQDELAQQIIDQKPSQTTSFVADNGTTEFYNYKQLYAIGMANLGIKLDEVVSGNSFTQQEMSRNFGLVFSFKHTVFDLTMDLLPSVIKEPLKQADKAKGASYVSTVTYGKVGLLVVESDTDSRDIKIVVNKIIQNQPLSGEESKMIESADLSYVYFNNETEVQVLKGKMNAIEAYKKGTEDWLENIYPLEFYLSDVETHSMNDISFEFNVPQ